MDLANKDLFYEVRYDEQSESFKLYYEGKKLHDDSFEAAMSPTKQQDRRKRKRPIPKSTITSTEQVNEEFEISFASILCSLSTTPTVLPVSSPMKGGRQEGKSDRPLNRSSERDMSINTGKASDKRYNQQELRELILKHSWDSPGSSISANRRLIHTK